jgi:PadR family transcriptional regulator, regulatory protein PadR
MRLSRATLAVLGALADDPSGEHYGYELMGRTGLKSGSLYPILIRLVDHGFLAATWEPDPPEGRPPRHLYRLTATGLEWVQQRWVQERRHGASGLLLSPRAAR